VEILAFDKQVQDSKKNATEALEQVSEIKQLIQEADDKTIRAQQALAGAEVSATNARDIAQQAQNTYAEQAGKVCLYNKRISSSEFHGVFFITITIGSK
jgi:coxsackievirus/adenovirus receptor